jgi:hypothetical protein
VSSKTDAGFPAREESDAASPAPNRVPAKTMMGVSFKFDDEPVEPADAPEAPAPEEPSAAATAPPAEGIDAVVSERRRSLGLKTMHLTSLDSLDWSVPGGVRPASPPAAAASPPAPSATDERSGSSSMGEGSARPAPLPLPRARVHSPSSSPVVEDASSGPGPAAQPAASEFHAPGHAVTTQRNAAPAPAAPRTMMLSFRDVAEAVDLKAAAEALLVGSREASAPPDVDRRAPSSTAPMVATRPDPEENPVPAAGAPPVPTSTGEYGGTLLFSASSIEMAKLQSSAAAVLAPERNQAAPTAVEASPELAPPASRQAREVPSAEASESVGRRSGTVLFSADTIERAEAAIRGSGVHAGSGASLSESRTELPPRPALGAGLAPRPAAGKAPVSQAPDAARRERPPAPMPRTEESEVEPRQKLPVAWIIGAVVIALAVIAALLLRS